MVDVMRRSLLAGGAAFTALSTLPPAIARAVSIPADMRSGTIRDVEHVVILMQENRGFDHYFGTLRGVRGFGDRFPIPLAPVEATPICTVWQQLDRKERSGPRLISPFHLSTRRQYDLMRMEGTPHSWPDAQEAWDEGRMAYWPEAKTERSMGYYRREDIPFQFALADAFTICDAYYCSAQTGTNTNRLFLWTGTNDPRGKHGGPAISNSHDQLPEKGGWPDSYTWTTYVERLQAAGIEWRIYQDMADNFTDNPLVGFARFRASYRNEAGSDPALRERALATYSLERLREDVLAGALPQVSYIIATAAGSEHPGPSSPAQGAAYTAEVLDALTANPKVWSRTALFIMFDENDGFFDHVPPPAPPSLEPSMPGGYAGASTVDTAGEYHLVPSKAAGEHDVPRLRGRPYGLGPRVPLYVVSPWSRGGWVNSEVFDHTSVIRFLEARFGVHEPNISAWRRAVCGDLTSAFDFASRHDGAINGVLPDPRPDAVRAAAVAKQIAPTAPTVAEALRQEPGVRPSRPLPYDPEVTAQLDAAAGVVRLELQARGRAAVVFHVYDMLNLDRVPRRYTVEAGRQLFGDWPLATLDKRYDLWVLGPNGFHRRFAGQARDHQYLPHLRWQLEDERLTVVTTWHAGARSLTVTPGAYHQVHSAWRATPGYPTQSWLLRETGGWYDFIIGCPDMPGYMRRLAGRLENGRPSISDPA